jgi:hypothetical protein
MRAFEFSDWTTGVSVADDGEVIDGLTHRFMA